MTSLFIVHILDFNGIYKTIKEEPYNEMSHSAFFRPSSALPIMGPGTFSPLAVRIENGVRYIYVKRQPGEGAQGRRTVIIVGLPLSLASSEKLNSVLSSAGEVEKSAVHPSKVSLTGLIKPCMMWLGVRGLVACI